MRLASWVVVLAAVASTASVAEARKPAAGATITRVSTARQRGDYVWRYGQWVYRATDGRSYVLMNGQWARVTQSNDAVPQQRTSQLDQTTVGEISPVDDLGPTVNGVPWYLNGRGAFSD